MKKTRVNLNELASNMNIYNLHIHFQEYVIYEAKMRHSRSVQNICCWLTEIALLQFSLFISAMARITMVYLQEILHCICLTLGIMLAEITLLIS